MCSFLIASRFLKIFIRKQTELIKQIYFENQGVNHHFFKNTPIHITDRLREEWDEWLNKTTLEVKRCWLPPKQRHIDIAILHTDASIAQMGGVLYINNEWIGEFKLPFSTDIVHWPIAAKEMLAIIYSLLHFGKYLKDKHIIEFCDNQNCCYSFTLDGSRDPNLNDLLVKVYRILHAFNSDMKVYWIPTALQIADKPSREIDLNEEFLPKIWFNHIIQVAGFQPTVDVMASISNHKCSKFITRACIGIPHDGIIGYDFLNLDEKQLVNEKLYCFPPKNMLIYVLNHLWLYYKDTKFILLYHSFQEIPLGLERFLNLKTCSNQTVSNKMAVTYFPSESIHVIDLDGRRMKINGTPNVRPKAIMMLVNNP